MIFVLIGFVEIEEFEAFEKKYGSVIIPMSYIDFPASGTTTTGNRSSTRPGNGTALFEWPSPSGPEK